MTQIKTTFVNNINPFTGMQQVDPPTKTHKHDEVLEQMFYGNETLAFDVRTAGHVRRSGIRYLHRRNASGTIKLRRKTDTRTQQVLMWAEKIQ